MSTPRFVVETPFPTPADLEEQIRYEWAGRAVDYTDERVGPDNDASEFRAERPRAARDDVTPSLRAEQWMLAAAAAVAAEPDFELSLSEADEQDEFDLASALEEELGVEFDRPPSIANRSEPQAPPAAPKSRASEDAKDEERPSTPPMKW